MTSFVTTREQFVHLRTLIDEPAYWRALNDEASSDQETVAQFAAKLHHLIGVPFRYLVPNNTMLPPESIRFFFVDQNWVDALIDGAMSLGRIGATDAAHDQALSPVVGQRAEGISLSTRRLQLGRPKAEEPLATPVYSGFLLRSAVVSGWPGLEVQAFKSAEGSGVQTKCSGEGVDLVRMDRLSNDVLLCLFAEQFGCVNIHEPKEGINFGATPILPSTAKRVDQVDPDKYTKQLRGLGIGGYPIAEFIQGAVVDVPFRSMSTRVVQVDALRQSIVAKLQSLQPPAWTGTAGDFTSAQFSLEMVEGASQSVFRADNTVPALATRPERLRSLADARAADRRALNAFLFGPEAEENA